MKTSNLEPRTLNLELAAGSDAAVRGSGFKVQGSRFVSPPVPLCVGQSEEKR
jgi:hypothetical protein